MSQQPHPMVRWTGRWASQQAAQLIERAVSLYRHREFDRLIAEGIMTMGSYSYGRPRVWAWRNPVTGRNDGGSVFIGSFCSIASGVEIFTGGNHRTDWVSAYPLNMRFATSEAWSDGHPATKGDVTIGNDVWLATGAKIFSGVTIGDGAVVGGYAVVTRDVRPYAIVTGNPAVEVRRRFTDHQIERLLAIQWWNWPDDLIAQRIPQLSCDRVDDFLEQWGSTSA